MRTLYIYILGSKATGLTVGYTDDIKRDILVTRTKHDKKGHSKLLYYETANKPSQAVSQYIGLKKLSNKEKKMLISISNPLWDDLSSGWL